MNAVVEVPQVAREYPVAPAQITPMQMLATAVASGADVEKMKQLMELSERWEANEARKAFVVALNAFKADPPDIFKNKAVDFTSAKGRTHYKHATLDQVSGIIGAALAKVGISHRWDVEQIEGGKIRVTCILTHAMGHSERVPLQASADESGNKNSIQAVGSTVTYLQRYTLLSATGMAVSEADDDGRGGGTTHAMEPVKRDEFAFAIDASTDKKKLEALWQQIATECTKAGDVEAYAELKALVAKKLKGLA